VSVDRWFSRMGSLFVTHASAAGAESAARRYIQAGQAHRGVCWGEIRASAVQVAHPDGHWITALEPTPPAAPAMLVDPVAVACYDTLSGWAVVSWGGPPMLVPAEPLTAVLAFYSPNHRATWGLGLPDDLRGTYTGPVEEQAGYPVAHGDERPRALLRSVLSLRMARRERDVMFAGATEAIRRDPVTGAWVVGDGPFVTPDPAADHRPDLTTTTVEGAAGHAAQYAPPGEE
jgi:hypothetical protein